MAAPLPRRFGKYVLQRRLGVGGMAETFVARRDDAVEQLVCVKRVLPAFNTDKDFITQFVREARVAAKLRHSNVVGILDFGEVEGEHYMALELVDGVDLRGLLQTEPEQRLAPELAALVAIQIAYGLEHAHASEVVHRDVTPSNILLSTHGEVKLADFGVAKALTGTSVATATGFIKGKVPYMAPEQMRGADIDGRVDLFSLGVTLFEALCGRRPFVGKHDVEVMMKVLEGERPTLSELAPDLPAGLSEVVERLLAQNPEDRFADGGEVVEALAPFVGNEEKARDRLAEKVRAAYGADTGEDIGTHDTALAVELPRVVAEPQAVVAAETSPAQTLVEVPEQPRRLAPWIGVGVLLVALVGGVSAVAMQDDDEVAETEVPPLVDTPATMVGSMEAASMETMAEIPRGELPPVETEMETEMAAAMTPRMVAMSPSMMTTTEDSETEMETVSRRPRGTVKIAVSPWGRVYYGGMDWRAPHTLSLPAGRHRVGVGQQRAVVFRQIEFEANNHRNITIDLEE